MTKKCPLPLFRVGRWPDTCNGRLIQVVTPRNMEHGKDNRPALHQTKQKENKSESAKYWTMIFFSASVADFIKASFSCTQLLKYCRCSVEQRLCLRCGIENISVKVRKQLRYIVNSQLFPGWPKIGGPFAPYCPRIRLFCRLYDRDPKHDT